MKTDVARQATLRTADGPRSWALRYWLCRETTPGGGRTYFLRAHAQVWEEAKLRGEEIEVVGGLGTDSLLVGHLFNQIVAARVFPSHLRDVVRDLTLNWTADNLCPPRAAVGHLMRPRPLRSLHP